MGLSIFIAELNVPDILEGCLGAEAPQDAPLSIPQDFGGDVAGQFSDVDEIWD